MDFEQHYSPRPLPKPPLELTKYENAVFRAPVVALRGGPSCVFIPDNPKPRKKIRTIAVGTTNRWRSPKPLIGDFLGMSQAHKSVLKATSSLPRRIKTGENTLLSPRHFHEKYHDIPFCAVSFNALGKEQLLRRQSRSFSSCSVAKSRNQVSRSLSYNYLSPMKALHQRFKDPLRLLEVFSRRANFNSDPDVLLHCCGVSWPLHSSYMMKSRVLRKLLDDHTRRTSFRHTDAQRISDYINSKDFYSDEYKTLTRRLTCDEREHIRVKFTSKGAFPRSINNLTLNLSGPWLTSHGFSMAFGHLYLDNAMLSGADVVETLAAASALEFHKLIDDCALSMIRNIAQETIGLYIEVAERYGLTLVLDACEKWLELNLISTLSTSVHLQHLPMFMLEKVLSSSHLFTYKEFAIFKTLCYWVYMQFHSNLTAFPTQISVLKFFSSRDASKSFLEREVGSAFKPLFSHLRLHGITDVDHLQDLVIMNVVPEPWLLQVLNHNYDSLLRGGDMPPAFSFSQSACRFGFTLNEGSGFSSDMIALHGFYFEVRVKKIEADQSFAAYIERLGENDPMLPSRKCKRSTFSLRKDRLTRYEIKFQYALVDNDGVRKSNRCFSTGVVEQRFGVTADTARSRVLKAHDVNFPLYVSVNILFPQS